MARKPKPPTELQLLKEELRRTQQELALAYQRFNEAAEPELVESCIYEIKAINARFGYLYRAIKAHSGEDMAAAAGPTGGVRTWV
ncbi:MAG: DUF2508 family protein [Oscillospiraceae bacterium]